MNWQQPITGEVDEQGLGVLQDLFDWQGAGPVLYPYQTRAVDDCVELLQKGKRTLLVAPTGSGKTVMAAEIARHFVTVRLVAHRIELVKQAKAIGIQAVTLAQALKLDVEGVDLLIIDEAHRAATQTYREIIQKYERAALLGLTATPLRTDGQGLCDGFEEMVITVGVRELIAEKRLVKYRALEAPDDALEELKALRRRGGDYAAGELAEVMDRPRLIGNIVREYKTYGRGRKTICFAVSVEHSVHLTEAFRTEGIRAVHLDGRSSEKLRAEGLAKLAHGDIDVLCNVNLFTEGWDCPSVSCVIMARPTTSLTLYLQSVGRGMRPAPGKDDLIILDHAGNIEAHGPPDQDREWSLESPQQKAKRLADVAELNRLHSLGFESIEAELEEKRRFIDATYSAQEICQRYDVNLATVAVYLRRRGIEPVRMGGIFRYPKKSVDSWMAENETYYSLEEAALKLELNRVNAHKTLARDGILPEKSYPERFYRFRKSDIDRVAHLISTTFTTKEVAGLLNISVGRVGTSMKLRGIKELKVFGQLRYAKSDIFAYREKLFAGIDVASAAELLGISKNRVPQFMRLRKVPLIKGVRPLRRTCQLYLRSVVEVIARDLENAYTPGQIRVLIGKSKIGAFIRQYQIPNVGGGSVAARYPRHLVDAALAKEKAQG